MLVLTRSVGESIVIGDDIIVKVIEVRGDVVRIGVEAPTSVRIHREEVYKALVEANQAAAAGSSAGFGAELTRAVKQGRHPAP